MSASGSSSASGSPAKPYNATDDMQQQLQKQLQPALQSVVASQRVQPDNTATSPQAQTKHSTGKVQNTSNGPSQGSSAGEGSISIQPKCPSSAGVAATTSSGQYPLAIPPGSIANQMMNRKARQPAPNKKKDKPTKIKKVS